VLNDLEAVHALNPEADPSALVPLPEQPDQQVGYAHLLELERRYGPGHPFLPEGATREYTVKELLEGVRPDPGAVLPHESHVRSQVDPSVVLSGIMLCLIIIAALAALILLRDNWPVAVLVIFILLLVPVIWAFLRSGGQLSGGQLLSVYRMGIDGVNAIRGLVMAVPQSAPPQVDASSAPDMAAATPVARERRRRSGAGVKGTATKQATNRN
jgi:hypothetical protein